MKKNILLFIFLLINNHINIKAIDTTSIKYFPLSVGNIYIYKTQSYPSGTISYSMATIPKDSIIYGKKYYYCYNFPHVYGWCRTDSITGSLYKFDTGHTCLVTAHDILIDSLAMRSGYFNACGQGLQTTCDGETNINLFNVSTTRLSFSQYYINSSWHWSYAKNFGLINYSSSYSIYSTDIGLTGCIINGVIYGDTSLHVGIINLSNTIIDNFILFQNYPNPFNPNTKIKYKIKEVRGEKLEVWISVYDITGKLIKEIINHKQSPGEYEIAFDGTNYSSGIYFYSMIVDGSLIETKKMLLIK